MYTVEKMHVCPYSLYVQTLILNCRFMIALNLTTYWNDIIVSSLTTVNSPTPIFEVRLSREEWSQIRGSMFFIKMVVSHHLTLN